jgi:hypothetical protein
MLAPPRLSGALINAKATKDAGPEATGQLPRGDCSLLVASASQRAG